MKPVTGELTAVNALLAHMPGAIRHGIARRLETAGATVWKGEASLSCADDPRPGIEAAVEAAQRELGSISALVVGWEWEGPGGLLEVSDSEIARALRCNVEEPLWWIQAALRAMARSRTGGRIVLLSSVGGLAPSRDGLLFAVTQATVQTLARVAALEQGRTVQVNTLALGWCEGGAYAQVLERPGVRAWMKADIPTGRVASIEDVANACAFLLSDQARAFNGEVMRLDGGYSLTKGSRPSALPPAAPGPGES